MSLRPYQRDIIQRAGEAVAQGHRRVLLVMATGAGKTVVAAQLIADTVRDDGRVLLMAHRRELVAQASQKLHAAGIDHGIIQAGFPARPGERVQVASVQTLHARAIRGSAIELPAADLVVVDEAHHVRALTWQRIIDAYPEAVVLGLTATPCRGDGRGLGPAFDTLVEGPSIPALVSQGFLVPTKVYAPSRPDLTGVRVNHGDYVESQLAERMDQTKLVGDIVTHWHRLAERRRTVVFATGVKHSMHLRDAFRQHDVVAEHIDGTTPVEERDGILAKLAAGTVEVVCNALVLTEGWDCPEASCLVLARPTKSLGLFRQMAGRVLRPAPGKTDAIILDHAGAVFEHGFIDDPVDWTLQEDSRAANTAFAAGGAGSGEARKLADCPECGAVRWSGKPCPACGWYPRPRPRAVPVADGDLAQVGADRTARAAERSPDQQVTFQGMLTYIAVERGYKEGWIAHKYREKFGVWPRYRVVKPILPDAEMHAWVHSRQIAYARTQGRS